MQILDIERVKRHLNIPFEITEDDMYIKDLIAVSQEVTETYLDRSLEDISEENGGQIPEPILHAILLEIGTLYLNREATAAVNISEVPMTYKFLLSRYKKYSIA